MGSATGELRLYALGIDEMCSIMGADPNRAEELRQAARSIFAAPPAERERTGLIGKLGPLFRRPPATPIVSSTQPEPHDVEVLLAGTYVAPERMGATWRVLEALVHAQAWGSTRIPLSPQEVDDLDFALARGGVSSSVGLRHLLDQPTGINLRPVSGLTVGWHRYEQCLSMAGAYRTAMPQIKSADQRAMIAGLVGWLDGFVPWAQAAVTVSRPAPDLIGFWAA